MAEVWTVLKVLNWTADYLKGKGIEAGRREAEILLAATLELDRVGLYLQFDRPLAADELNAFRQRVGRRARREPLQYILGTTEFWSLPFKVSPAVLVPRADTEVLVEEALARVVAPAAILDVGTGSGILAVTLAREYGAATVVAVDIAVEALAIAADNAVLNGVAERVTFREEDLGALAGGPFDLIVSNPPYIPAAEIATLMPEVRDFEPPLALAGGDDGLACYRSLIPQLPRLLNPGGWVLLEIGIGQAPAVQMLLEQIGLGEIFVRADYAGIPRVVGGRRGV